MSTYESTKETAKKIRNKLKKTFPNIPSSTFSVRSSTNTVEISWVDFPLPSDVIPLVTQYKGRSFDGRIDLEELNGYTDPDTGEHIQGYSYIRTNYTISQERKEQLLHVLRDELRSVGRDYDDLSERERYIEVDDINKKYSKDLELLPQYKEKVIVKEDVEHILGSFQHVLMKAFGELILNYSNPIAPERYSKTYFKEVRRQGNQFLFSDKDSVWKELKTLILANLDDIMFQYIKTEEELSKELIHVVYSNGNKHSLYVLLKQRYEAYVEDIIEQVIVKYKATRGVDIDLREALKDFDSMYNLNELSYEVYNEIDNTFSTQDTINNVFATIEPKYDAYLNLTKESVTTVENLEYIFRHLTDYVTNEVNPFIQNIPDNFPKTFYDLNSQYMKFNAFKIDGSTAVFNSDPEYLKTSTRTLFADLRSDVIQDTVPLYKTLEEFATFVLGKLDEYYKKDLINYEKVDVFYNQSFQQHLFLEWFGKKDNWLTVYNELRLSYVDLLMVKNLTKTLTTSTDTDLFKQEVFALFKGISDEHEEEKQQAETVTDLFGDSIELVLETELYKEIDYLRKNPELILRISKILAKPVVQPKQPNVTPLSRLSNHTVYETNNLPKDMKVIDIYKKSAYQKATGNFNYLIVPNDEDNARLVVFPHALLLVRTKDSKIESHYIYNLKSQTIQECEDNFKKSVPSLYKALGFDKTALNQIRLIVNNLRLR